LTLGQRTFSSLVVALALSAIASLTTAQGSGQTADEVVDEVEDEKNPAQPRIIAEYAGLVPGQTNTLALTFDIKEDWHVYWQGQNDTGFPVFVEWSLPQGFAAGELLWPTPHRHVAKGGILDHIYEDGEATLLLPVDVPETAEPGSVVTISAEAEWLVCREACIPGFESVEASFVILEPGETPPASPDAGRIAEARRRLPVPIPEGATDIEVRWIDGVLAIDAGRPVKRLEFLPHESGREIENPLKTATSDDGKLRLKTGPGDEPVRGIIVMDLGDKARPRLNRIETSPPGETRNTARE